jgi:hypothetical protein
MTDLPSRSVWAEAFCEHEGHGVRAATVAVLVRSDPELPPLSPLVFTIRNAEFAYGVRDFDLFVDAIWSEPDPTTVATLAAAVQRRDFDALRAACREYAPFWCRACRRSYCRAHWTLEAEFDPPGQFDYYHGSCPAGHRTMIDHI